MRGVSVVFRVKRRFSILRSGRGAAPGPGGAIEAARSRRRRRRRGGRRARPEAQGSPAGPSRRALEAAGGSSRVLTCMPAIMTGLRVALEATFLDWVGLATTALRVDITMEFMLIVRWFRRCLLL